MFARIIGVRSHKNVVFADAIVEGGTTDQLLFMRTVLGRETPNVGDLIDVECQPSTSRAGKHVLAVNSISQIRRSISWHTGKDSSGNTGADLRRDLLLNACSGGNSIQVFWLKNRIVSELRRLLCSEGFTELQAPVLLGEDKGEVSPARVANPRMRDSVLRVTFERILRDNAALLLTSFFSIGSVFRNMGENANHANEFLSLEFTALGYKEEQMLNLILRMAEIGESLVGSSGVKLNDGMDIVKTMDYETYARKKESGTLPVQYVVVNMPTESSFAEAASTGAHELRWYACGHCIGHGYHDTVTVANREDLDDPEDASDTPAAIFDVADGWARPQSMSFGMGIDRWIMALVGLENIIESTHPLGL